MVPPEDGHCGQGAPLAGRRAAGHPGRAMFVELQFPALGAVLPTDHGYELYAALSRLVPALHRPDFPCLIGPVAGESVGRGMLSLSRGRSRLRFRLPADAIPELLPLAGRAVEVAGHRVRL